MKFTEMKLKGAYLIEPEPIQDHRGFFARAWCEKEFDEQGLNSNLVQCNISFNHKRGTLRGMHYQAKPHEEAKLVRCTMGAIYDVIVDICPDSPTFKQWVGVKLTAQNRRMLYIPEGMAHGFQTLEDNTEVFYQMSEFYHPESSKGILWNDPSLEINWLINESEKLTISDKDKNYATFNEIFNQL